MIRSLGPVDDAVVRGAVEGELGEPVTINLVARSSNHVYRIETRSARSYSLRVPHLAKGALSPFWRQLGAIFGHDYHSKFAAMPQLESILRAGGVEVPRLVADVDLGSGRTGYLFTWVEGRTWEPDAFPESDEIHLALGRYLGAIHQRTFDGFGAVGAEQLRPSDEYVSSVNASVTAIIDGFWPEAPAVRRAFEEEMAGRDHGEVASAFSAIMPDISGNQFVYGEDEIAGVVDLDSYVVGPRELELTIAEWGLTRPDAFRGGYEEYLPLPRFEPFRNYHRVAMLVNDPEPNIDVGRMLNENVHFA